MKKIIYILIGIIIGSVTTYFLKPELKAEPSESSPLLFETLGMRAGEFGVQDLSTDELYIGLWENNTQTIVSKKNPEKQIEIFAPPHKDAMTSLSIRDKSGKSLTFFDKDSDGIWDFSYLEGNGDTYFYNGLGGFPGRINLREQGSLARISDEYFKLKLINQKRYIEREDKLIEVIMVNPGLIKIKVEKKSSLEHDVTESDLEKYQQEVIRKGMPALPIPLTKEMDEQLVREGILPPQ